ncbi:MAG: hypothetical protein ACI9DK_002511 [Vicingaceae bacterium]|jgi:hypothetical protein
MVAVNIPVRTLEIPQGTIEGSKGIIGNCFFLKETCVNSKKWKYNGRYTKLLKIKNPLIIRGFSQL